jgi:signal transduction histidine kinase
MMPSPLQLLILEGSVFAAESAVTALERGNFSCAWDHVQTPKEVVARLERCQYDLILADCLPPGVGLGALNLVRGRGIDIPFIVCSASLGEEALTEVFRAGATDYVLKTRLDRLPSVVARVLKERDDKGQRAQQQEAGSAALLRIATDIQGTLDLREILDRVQGHVLPLLPCDHVLTYRWNSSRRAFELLAEHDVPETLRVDADGVDRSPAELVERWIERGRGSAILSMPFKIRGALGGVMVAVREGSSVEFEPRAVQLFERIVQQVAMAMGTADIYRAKDEEAQLNGALAEIGYELISGGNDPDLLNRLCQVTTRVLGCGRSYTALWEPKEQVYLPVASHGYTIDEWEALRVLKLPRIQLADILARLERQDVVPVAASENGGRAGVATSPPIPTSLWMALRRRGLVEGLHIATFDKPAADLPRHHERLGHELAHLASLAIDNVRLVEELKDANRLKSDFVATMSHELRTPLTHILGYTDLVLQAAFGPLTTEQAHALHSVQKSGRQILDLVSATLDVSRLDADTLPVHLVQTAVRELLAEVEADTCEMRQQSGLGFAWNVPTDVGHIETDRLKLKIVVMNLIGNAIKFTPQGSVTVTAGMRGEGIAIAVADTGIGIAPDVRSIIFEPFRQGNGATTSRSGGVGLGLYIVRRLLDLLGGTIEVESQVGSGSTFRVWVPRTIAPRQGQTLNALARVRHKTAGAETPCAAERRAAASSET